jgi:hypothetical protein
MIADRSTSSPAWDSTGRDSRSSSTDEVSKWADRVLGPTPIKRRPLATSRSVTTEASTDDSATDRDYLGPQKLPTPFSYSSGRRRKINPPSC